jgi:hypothetical protein
MSSMRKLSILCPLCLFAAAGTADRILCPETAQPLTLRYP